MSDYDEYGAKARGQNQNGNTDHRKPSSGLGCPMVAAPAVGVIAVLLVLAIRWARR